MEAGEGGSESEPLMKELITVEPGKMFFWKKGSRLEAIEPTVIVLPGYLIRDGEDVSSIIETASGEVFIGFTHGLRVRNYTEIRLRLGAGQSATVRRSADVMLASDEQGERKLYLTVERDDAV